MIKMKTITISEEEVREWKSQVERWRKKKWWQSEPNLPVSCLLAQIDAWISQLDEKYKRFLYDGDGSK